ncbi:MAG: peptide chain release factor 2 [Nitrospiraceae bacterium]|nr:peptide chain release factor 2 [Nitrospiraceae bacterium]
MQALRDEYQSNRERLEQLRRHLDPDRLTLTLEQLEAQTADPEFWKNAERATRLLREKRRIEKRRDLVSDLGREEEEIGSLLEMGDDPDFLSEAAQTLPLFIQKIDQLELEEILSDEYSDSPAIIEIHPGAGGTESQDWAQMLLRMYLRWSESRGFESAVIDLQPGEEAGIKSATIRVRGENAFGFLQAESGVHRLVRISPFDAAKRRHTSFASVFVYPEIEGDITVEIRDEDIRIDTFRASSAGGQHVNKTSSAVRLTHMPTGIVISSQNERSQIQNREMAFKVLKAKLFELERQKKKEALDQISGAGNKKENAWGSQIRSYVLQPYQIVKDHRTGIETSRVDEVLDGRLDLFIRGYLLARWEGRLFTGRAEDLPEV